MKSLLKYFLFVLLLVVSVSCKKDPPPVLTISSEQLTLDYTASTSTITIKSNYSWSLSSSADWITVSPMSSLNESSVTVVAKENKTYESRSADIVVSTGKDGTESFLRKTIRVTQSGKSNTAPDAPIITFPANNASDFSRLAYFRWNKALDPDNDVVRYELQVSQLNTFDEGPLTTIIRTDTLLYGYSPALLKENTRYYWRVYSIDTQNSRAASSVYSFVTGTTGGYVNGEYRVAFTNTKGTYPNEIVFTGDGYAVENFLDGAKFEKDMNDGIEAFFSVEPYKSYRDYFKVYKLAVYSQDNGVTQTDQNITKKTAFSTVFKGGSSMETDDALVFKKVETIPDVKGKLNNTLVVLVVNQDRYAGTCWMWSDGKAIAISPASTSTRNYINFKNIINHEAGGHGFGRLADEYITAANKDKTITESEKSSLTAWTKYGFYPNVDTTSNLTQIKWKNFVDKTGYLVRAYEGAYYFTFGVWRPETSSCMIDNRQYYNAPSREHIVKRILRTSAGVRINDYSNGVITPIPNDPFNFDEFVRLDVDKTESATRFYKETYNPLTFVHLAPPVMIEVK